MSIRNDLERLRREAAEWRPGRRDVSELTDAELLDAIGLGPAPTDEQLEALAGGVHEHPHGT